MRIIGWVILIVFIISLLCFIPAYIGTDIDYMKTITVDSSEKVEYAISNAVHDVKSRNFVVNTLSVKYCWIDKTFVIRCGGIDRGNLLKK